MNNDEVMDHVFDKSAGAMEPNGLGYFARLLLENDLDVNTIVHDDDASGYIVAQNVKRDFLSSTEHPERFTEYLRELLCLRHGAKNIAKSFIK